MFSGIAAQLIATKGASLRFDLSWIKRAKTSLPEPLGPSTITLASERATLLASSNSLILDGSATIGPSVSFSFSGK